MEPTAKGSRRSFVRNEANCHFVPRAEWDLTDCYAYILLDKEAPAEKLLLVAGQSSERLADNPNLGTAWRTKLRELRGIRFYPMPAPYRSYVIYYRATEKSLDVIRVLHGARDVENVLRGWVD